MASHSITIIGNHNIDFQSRSYEGIYSEIESIVNKSLFPNERFLRLFALKSEKEGVNDIRKIHKLKNRVNWTIDIFEFDGVMDIMDVELLDPFGFGVHLNEHSLRFDFPLYNYTKWFENADSLFRDECRKYFQYVVNLFGGDRVLYAAGGDHFLDDFTFYKGTFIEMENELYRRYRASKSSFQAVAEDIENTYLIDDFSDIDWTKNLPLDDYLPEPDDKSSIDFDLKKYDTKDKLRNKYFEEQVLLHKISDDETHFYCLARIKGLLCVSKGIVGGQDELKVSLDEYAPFTYDKLIEKLKKEGYKNNIEKVYIIEVLSDNCIKEWKNTFEEFSSLLTWQGLGDSGYSYVGDKPREVRGKNYTYIKQVFSTVDKRIALLLLRDLTYKHNAHEGHIRVLQKEKSNESNQPF